MRLKQILKTSKKFRGFFFSFNENSGEKEALGSVCYVAHTPFPKWLLLVECETRGMNF